MKTIIVILLMCTIALACALLIKTEQVKFSYKLGCVVGAMDLCKKLDCPNPSWAEAINECTGVLLNE